MLTNSSDPASNCWIQHLVKYIFDVGLNCIFIYKINFSRLKYMFDMDLPPCLPSIWTVDLYPGLDLIEVVASLSQRGPYSCEWKGNKRRVQLSKMPDYISFSIWSNIYLTVVLNCIFIYKINFSRLKYMFDMDLPPCLPSIGTVWVKIPGLT